MKTVAIAGVGLIGGSFALALRKSGFEGRILGVSSARTIAEARSLGVIDEGATLAEAAARADLIYLAQPIQKIIAAIADLKPVLRPGTLVTDAGSTKSLIAKAAREHLPAGAFIGGHPMAGKETRGVSGADAALFQGRNYILTPDDPAHLDLPAARWFRAKIDSFGARASVLTPEQHDELVAFTSHLPQLLSTALASVLGDAGESARTAGPAALEMTRVAMSPFDMWSDIFATNGDRIGAALGKFIGELESLRARLNDPAMRESFERAAESAKRLRASSVIDFR